MRKLMLLATMVALVVAMVALSAVPAFAKTNGNAVRVECTNNQNQLVTVLSSQSGRLCNNIGNTRVNEFFPNNNEFVPVFQEEFVPEVVQAPAQTFVSGSNVINGGSVTSGGNNSNTCSAQQNFNNSGGLLNQQQVQQFGSPSNGGFFDNGFFDNGLFGGGGGNIFTGSTFNNAPSQYAPCNPSVEQSAAASSGY